MVSPKPVPAPANDVDLEGQPPVVTNAGPAVAVTIPSFDAISSSPNLAASAPDAAAPATPDPDAAGQAALAPEGPAGGNANPTQAAPAAPSPLAGAAAMKTAMLGGLSKLTGTERQSITAQLSRGQFNADEDIANRMQVVSEHEKKHSELGQSIQGMAAGPERDTALKQFSQSSKGLADLVKDVGERATMYSNDPNSNFKMDKEEISEYVNTKGENIQETMGGVKNFLDKEKGNDASLKQGQQQQEEMNAISAMLKKLMDWVKNMFSPNKPSATAGPKPGG